MIVEQSKTETRHQLFIDLYENVFPAVSAFIQKMGGTLEDTKDIFQDGLIIYYEKTRGQPFITQISEEAYLTGICKHLWYRKYQQEKRMKKSEATKELKAEAEEEPAVLEKIMELIEQSGKKCLELLQSFYFEKRDMKEIAQLFGFSGARSATAQKYKCLEKIRRTIKDQSLDKEDFYE